MPAAAKTPFEGRLRDAVNGTYGARPFAYEISLATHLMQKGWDVDFVDYLGVARFDFLARQGVAERYGDWIKTKNPDSPATQRAREGLRPCVAGAQQTSPSESGRVAQKFTRAALHSCRVRTEMGEFDVEAFVARLDRMGMTLRPDGPPSGRM